MQICHGFSEMTSIFCALIFELNKRQHYKTSKSVKYLNLLQKKRIQEF